MNSHSRNSLIPPNSGWVLTSATGINDKGQIIGQGTYNGQVNHGFLLTAGLTLSITDTTPMPGIARPGDTIHYTINALAAPANAASLTLNDPIPVGTTLVSSSITGGGALTNGAIDWSFSNNSNVTVAFNVKVNDAAHLPAGLGAITDAVSGQASFPDGIVADATASDTVKLVLTPAAISVKANTIHAFARFPIPDVEQPIATFTDSDTTLTAGDFSASIRWGDGHSSSGVIKPDPAGGFDVIANHKYAAPKDSYNTTVTVRGPAKSVGAGNGEAEIQPALEVNSIADTDVADLSQHTGWTGAFLSSGALEVTLGSAIEQADKDGRGEIDFNIAGDGVPTIQPLASYGITAPIYVDGATQPGSGEVEISGVAITSGTDGFDILNTNGAQLRGLVINRFAGFAISIFRGSGIKIQGNFIGTDPTGMTFLGNGSTLNAGTSNASTVGGGIEIRQSSKILVGGTSPSDRNVISGNFPLDTPAGSTSNGHGILIADSASKRNIIEGNYIGPNAAGNVTSYSQDVGIELSEASFNTIGGALAGAGNVIGGNVSGVVVTDALPDTSLSDRAGVSPVHNVIQGNDIHNNSIGINLSGAKHTTVGGSQPSAPNQISGSIFGIDIDGGQEALASLSPPVESNVIQRNTISKNQFGVKISGCSGNLIGSTKSELGNTITNNGSAAPGSGGIVIESDSIADTSNPILGNSIFQNTGLGIDLGADGVTANGFTLTPRIGANKLINYPVLSSAAVNVGKITIQGTLDYIPRSSFLLQFFASATPNASGFGEGQLFLGSTTIKTDAVGVAMFSVVLRVSPAVAAGYSITATTTDPAGDTSEFSKAILAG